MYHIPTLRSRKALTAAMVAGFALAMPFFGYAQSIVPAHPLSPPAHSSSAPSLASKQAIAHSSLAFEANKGQTDKRVQFLARGAGYALFLTPTRAVFDFQETPFRKALRPQADLALKPTRHQVVAMQLLGSAPHPAIAGSGLLPGIANYYRSNDPKQGLSNIPTYDKVRYSGVYPGVDLLYYGNQQTLEYDFIVAPHHDPNRIAFKMQGAKSLKVDGHGDLVIGLSKGAIRWHKPVLYQEIQGQRKSVDGHYRLQGDRIAFAVAQYDTSRPLVIDPQLAYSTYLGGSTADYGNGIATYLDTFSGKTYVYVTGETTSSNFPTTTGPSFSGGSDAFVTKFDMTQSGNSSVVYSTVLRVNSNTYNIGNAISIDSAGSAYIGGNSYSSSSPYGFVAKFSSSGTYAYAFATTSSIAHSVTGIAVDVPDTFWITGTVQGSNQYFYYPGRNDGFFPSSSSTGGSFNGYVRRLIVSGTTPTLTFDYFSLFSSFATSGGTGIAVDSATHLAYITGYGTSVPTTSNALQATSGGGSDAVIFVVDGNQTYGASLLYGSYLGGSANDTAYAITVVTQGTDKYTYVAGTTSPGTGFPTVNGYPTTYLGTTGGDAFLCKFKNLTGSTPSMTYSTLLGYSGQSALAVGVAADTSGIAYITGDAGVNFPITKDAWQPYGGVFVSKIDTTLSGTASLLYSTYLGGNAYNQAASIAIDGSANAYITGTTDSYVNYTTTPFNLPLPTTATAYQTMFQSTGGIAGSNNAFVTKLSTTPITHFVPFDFDGDGLNDLLFQSSINNDVYEWFTQAYRVLAGSSTSINPATPWNVVGVGDFDGDGHPDIVFQNGSTGVIVIWYMNIATVTGSVTLPATPGVGWTVAGVADFNGDGHPDLLLQNTSTGAVVIWFMGNTSGHTGGYDYLSGVTLGSTLPSGYTVAGAGKFGGTENSDIVLQNTTTGVVKFWLLSNVSPASPTNPAISSTPTLTGATTALALLPSGYRIGAIADYNSDGNTDLVLQNSTGEATLFLFLQGTYVTGGGTIDTTPPTGYILVGPH